MVKKLFLTPDTLPSERWERCLSIPASKQWLGIVNKALLELTNIYNYEQLDETDLTPQQAADAAYDMYVTYLLGDCQLRDCDELLACSTTLSDIVQSQGIVNPNSVDPANSNIVSERFPPEERQQPAAELPPDCDLDVLWGGCLELATRLDGYGLDWLEIALANTDLIDRAAELVEMVPVLGDIGASLLQLLSGEIENLKNAYEAHSSLSVIDEIACDLFRIGCSECRFPTYEEIIQHYATLGIAGMDDWLNAALQLMVDYLINSTASTNAVVYYSVNAFQLYIRGLGATFLNQGDMEFVRMWAQLGMDSPSDDWLLLCGDCTPVGWSAYFDFSTGQQDWQVEGTYGVYQNGRFESVYQGGDERLVIYRDFAVVGDVNEVTANVHAGNIADGGFRGIALRRDGYPSEPDVSETFDAGTGDFVWVWTTGVTDAVRVYVVVDNNGRQGTNWISSVSMSGDGPNPL